MCRFSWAEVEFATLEWVAWFNTERLLAPLGYRPPTEYEAQQAVLQSVTETMGVLN